MLAHLLPSVVSSAILSSYSSSSSSSPSSSSSSSSTQSKPPSHRDECSPLQHAWQTQHPIYCAIQHGKNIRDFLNTCGIASKYYDMLGDLSELRPPSTALLSMHDAPPKASDYVQLPCHIWAPDFFYPHLVLYMPCAAPKCDGRATRQRWNPNGARVVHDVHSAAYLRCWQYKCLKCNVTFAGWDESVLAKLNPAVRTRFRFVLTHEGAITQELHQRIIDTRVHGGSLKQLQNELNRNRHTRMHETLIAYYRHCEYYKLSQQSRPSKTLGSSGSSSSGGGAGGGQRLQKTIGGMLYSVMSGNQGAPQPFAVLRPELQPPPDKQPETDEYYVDYPAPSIAYMGQRQQAHAALMEPLWKRHTQQLTADRVCIDATFKVPKKLTNSSFTRLWSMMDVETGCLLHQQMLTHETQDDVLPMMWSYAQRCTELGRPLPTRVCSDRGLMDARLINDPCAFPDAHITVDPWHFNMRFAKTLHKGGLTGMWKDVHLQFNAALYRDYIDPETGQVERTHAEPEQIIHKVNMLIDTYKKPGTWGGPITGKATEDWWAAQIDPIRLMRILSHPRPDDSTTAGKMSSSMLENYHRHLNRLLKVVKFSKEGMHSFLGEFMFRWNTDRRRAAGREHDWVIYDMPLLHASYTACERVLTREVAAESWPGGAYRLPEPLQLDEYFGLVHPNVSLEARMKLASSSFPLSADMVEEIVQLFLSTNSTGIIPSDSLLDQVISATLTTTTSPAPTPIPTPTADSNSSDSNSGDSSDYTNTIDDVDNSSGYIPVGSDNAAAGKVQLPVQRMNVLEEVLLACLIQKDSMIQSAIVREHWHFAAGRWNSFVKGLMEHPRCRTTLRGLHMVTGDIIKHSITGMDQKAQRATQHQLIRDQSKAVGVSFTMLSARDQPITEYEHEQLRLIVNRQTTHNTDARASKNNVKTKWGQVAVEWMYQYTAEMGRNQPMHVHPRTEAVLKSYWQNWKKKKKAAAAAAAASGAPGTVGAWVAQAAGAQVAVAAALPDAAARTLNPPPLSNSSSSLTAAPSTTTTTTTSSTSSTTSSSSAASSLNPAPHATEASGSPLPAAAGTASPSLSSIYESPSKRLEVHLRSVVSSAARTLGFGVGLESAATAAVPAAAAAAAATARRPSSPSLPPPPPPPLPPPSSSAAPSSASSSASSSSAASPTRRKWKPAAAGATSVIIGTSSSTSSSSSSKRGDEYHWPKRESEYYTKLYTEREFRMTYKQFAAEWPQHFTPKSEKQWYSKNRTIKNAAKRQMERMAAEKAKATAAGYGGRGGAGGGGGGGGGRGPGSQQLQQTVLVGVAGKRQSPQTEKGREYQQQLQEFNKRRRTD